MSVNSMRLPRDVVKRTHSSVQNPNDKKNRVPGEVEREGLRKLIESNLDVEKLLGEQVIRLQTSQKALSDRLMRQQLELEAAQSELFETNGLIESLEIQRATLQKRTLNLSALIHPIRRLPAEIVKYIFESIVEVSEEKLEAASSLSSVCQSWREIAFDTPRLRCTMNTCIVPSIKTLWTQWIRLVKSIPVDICINDLEEDDLVILRRLRLFRIPNLKVLTLCLSYAATIDTLCKALFNTSYMPLRELSISLLGNPIELHLDTLVGYVSSLTTLRLVGPISLHLQPNFTSSLVNLVLEETPELDFHGVMLFLPLLETLELYDVTFAIPNGPQIVTSTNIRRLVFFSTPIFDQPWVVDLSFPRLTSLLDSHQAKPLFLRFVESHPSIRELDCHNETEDQLIEEISASSQVTHLSITSGFPAFVDWRTFGLLEVPFPSLQVLMFGDQVVPPDVVEFEGVIRARCLPMNHPKSLLERENLLLKELRILVGRREWEGEAWSLHALAQEASREIVPYNEIDGWYCVVLRWNVKLDP